MVDEGFILSPLQQRLWRLGQNAAPGTYHVQADLSVVGALGTETIEAALRQVVAAYEILRTGFRVEAGMTIPLQVITKDGEPIIVAGIAGESSGKDEGSAISGAGFDPSAAAPLRARVSRLSPTQHRLLLELPAICGDAESLQIIAAALCRYCAAAADGGASADEAPDFVQYADYAQWQHDLLHAAEYAAGRAFWQKRIPANLSRRDLPFARSADDAEAFRPQQFALLLRPETARRLHRAAEGVGVSAEAFLATCWLTTLTRVTGDDEPTIGLISSLRQFDELIGAPGPMSKTWPLVAVVDNNASFATVAAQIAQAIETGRQHADYFDWGSEGAAPDRALLRFPAGFDFLQVEPVRIGDVTATVERLEACIDRFQLQLSCFARGDDALQLVLRFDASRLSRESAAVYGTILTDLLDDALAQPGAPIGSLGGPRAAEAAALRAEIEEFGDAPVYEQCIHKLVETQARRFPERVAVVCDERRLTYAELDALANRWARHLQKLGIGPEDPVLVMLERSTALPVMLLAVLKAGGAYVPLDAETPAGRVAQILDATGATLLLVSTPIDPALLPGAVRQVLVDEQRLDAVDACADPVRSGVTPSQLVYVIFTSGSTGTPKGVAVEHRQLCNYLDGVRTRLALDDCESFALVSSVAADLGNTVLFSALLLGGRLIIASRQEMLDGQALARRFDEERGVDCLKIAPSHLKLLFLAAADRRAILPKRRLILGGESFDFALARELRALAPGCRIFNHYGPTETTVGVLTHELPQDLSRAEAATVPLGKPLPHVSTFVLDDALHTLPVGAVGELCIAGANVARGYYRDPMLTAERFVSASPVVGTTVRLYRTGDRVRRLPDGGIEFLGRRDRQVKLNGFRVELAEIEAAARTHSAVANAAALVREIAVGRQGLALFFASPERLAEDTLREYLQDRLPAHMIPGRVIGLPALPLTQSGKIDYQALAILPLSQVLPPTGSGEPSGPVETLLTRVWSEVLGLPSVRTDADFFNLGGDSILGIQIVARAREAGLDLSPIQLFEHRTIAALAAVTQPLARVEADQGPVSGEVPLTPIQHWFFQHDLPEPGHWNLSLLVETEPDLDAGLLEQVVQHAVEQHDALRIYFERHTDGWRQVNAAATGPVTVRTIDLSSLPPEQQAICLESAASALQASLDLATPPLLRVALFRLGDGRNTRVLFVVHHLVMDAVSWRIFLETVAKAYATLKLGGVVSPTPKTSSFKYWAERLDAHAQSPEARQQLALWRAAAQHDVTPLPRDWPGEIHTVAGADTLDVTLDAGSTHALLREVPVAYQTGINDALLTALAWALAGWIGSHTIKIELEGHGRERLFDDVDCSGTIGWFTSRWPQVLTLDGCAEIGAALRSIKEQLRRVPDGGIGYGVLRYLSRSPDIAAALAHSADPEISFNYLGQVDFIFPTAGGWRPAPESSGAERSGKSIRRQLIAIDAMVMGGELRMSWTYSRDTFARATIDRLARRCLDAIGDIVHHCAAVVRGGYTPSDFPLARLNQAQLDRILAGYTRGRPELLSPIQQLMALHLLWEDVDDDKSRRILEKLSVEDIYGLSPMQQGLLFDMLYTGDPTLYLVQKAFIIEGKIDPLALKKAWAQVVSRHPILRSVLVWDGVDAPIQVVLNHIETPWLEEDWSNEDEPGQDRRLAAYLAADRENGLALDRPVPMRLALVRFSSDRHALIWTHHHVFIDGWCNSLLMRELLAFARSFSDGQPAPATRATPYRDYIAWLAQHPSDMAEAYWRDALQGVRLPTPLPFEHGLLARTGPASSQQLSFTLSAEETADLNATARQLGLTPSVLLNATWGLLLFLHSGERDVVFGVTVAGRPAELPGVETMVGLMINVLPLRLRVEPDMTLREWLGAVQERQTRLLEHQYSALPEVRRWAGAVPNQPLFESHLSVENYPVDPVLRATGQTLRIHDVRSTYSTSYPLSITVEPEAELRVEAVYDAARLAPEALRTVFRQWRALLAGLDPRLDRLVSAVTASIDNDQSISEVYASRETAL